MGQAQAREDQLRVLTGDDDYGNRSVNAFIDRPPQIRVLLVGQSRLLAEALAMVLEGDPDISLIGIHLDSMMDLASLAQSQPDVVLVHHHAHSTSGGEVAEALLAQRSASKFVVVTPTNDANLLAAYVRAGAIGYITADQSASDLVRSIKRAHAGEVLFAPEELVQLLTRPQPSAPTVPLGARELEVLQSLADGLSTTEVAERLCITVHTVRTHLKNLMTKLQARSKTEAIVVALRHGWIALPATAVPPNDRLAPAVASNSRPAPAVPSTGRPAAGVRPARSPIVV